MNRARGISCRALLGTASVGAIIALLTIPGLTQTRPQAPKVGDPPEAMNMRLVGHNDLQARTAYQPTIFKQGGRYIAYVGHHGGSKDNPAPHNRLSGQNELNGTSVLDVTDPKAPKYLAHIPGAVGDGEAGASQMTRVCDGRTLGTRGRDPGRSARQPRRVPVQAWGSRPRSRGERAVGSRIRQRHEDDYPAVFGLPFP